MFSYKNSIKSYLTGTSSRKKQQDPGLFFKFSISNIPQKKLIYNSIDLSEIKDLFSEPIHSPKVPQLPSLSTPRKKLSPRRSQSIDSSPSDTKEKEREREKEKEKTFRSTVPSKLNSYMCQNSVTTKEPESFSPRSTNLRFSSLNTRYQSNEGYIMENLEKAKKYFPIPLGRKQLRTTSMSISHTPMSRLFSPQNFSSRTKRINPFYTKHKDVELPPDIEIKGKSAFKRKIHEYPKYTNKDLYAHLIEFFERVDIYKKKFEEIDRAKKGYVLIEDFIAICERSDIAKKLFRMFSGVSGHSKINKRDFLAVASIYEHNNGEFLKFNFNNEDLVCKLEKQLEEMREIFEFHAQNNKIHKKYLQEATEFLQPTEDVYKSESLILTETVNFSWFLRCAPYFLRIHTALLNKTAH